MLPEGSLVSPCSLCTKHSINSLELSKLEENRTSHDQLRGKRGQSTDTASEGIVFEVFNVCSPISLLLRRHDFWISRRQGII